MIKLIKKPYIIIGLGLGVGVVTCVVKVLQRQNKEEIIATESNRISRALKIPKGFVGHVLGRGGSTIKSIREKTKARVTFDDTDNEFTVATITGSPESVEEAVDLINGIINNRHACVTKEIILQERITDSVWKNVNCIKQICDLTKAKIMFDFHPAKKRGSQVKILIKGREEEVEAAVELIDELVAESSVSSNKQIHVAGRALPENVPPNSSRSGVPNLPVEKLIPNSSDGFVEVFVSSVENPGKFWVQISGSKSCQLDRLATEMTEFYNEAKNQLKLHLNSIAVGDIVAAFFKSDNSWYRAQVAEVTNEGDELKEIAVFYLDFGDFGTLTPNLICILDPNFLSLPFQAIECCLAEVEPTSGNWYAEATEEFEKMVYLAQWKIIMAKPIHKQINNGDSYYDSPQLVKLVDTNLDKDNDIAEELVSRGFATYNQ